MIDTKTILDMLKHNLDEIVNYKGIEITDEMTRLEIAKWIVEQQLSERR